MVFCNDMLTVLVSSLFMEMKTYIQKCLTEALALDRN
jgi:hypothetical protein